jgi:peptidoglycan/xylan/chitin deacetylase (PgdA/CDA1 family)
VTPPGNLPPTRVVYYHRVGPLTEDRLTGRRGDAGAMITPPEQLEAQVTLLREHGYRLATAGELASAWRAELPPPGMAVLTFDDGWRDAVTTAAPLLARLGVRATFFVCPGGFGKHFSDLDGEPALLTEAEVRALHEAGMEIGSHSMSHPDLRVLRRGRLRRELVSSRKAVEALTGQPCVTLAYPSGGHDGRVERAAAKARYRLAFTDRAGPWRRLAVPRVQAPTVQPPEALIRRLELTAEPA